MKTPNALPYLKKEASPKGKHPDITFKVLVLSHIELFFLNNDILFFYLNVCITKMCWLVEWTPPCLTFWDSLFWVSKIPLFIWRPFCGQNKDPPLEFQGGGRETYVAPIYRECLTCGDSYRKNRYRCFLLCKIWPHLNNVLQKKYLLLW